MTDVEALTKLRAWRAFIANVKTDYALIEIAVNDIAISAIEERIQRATMAAIDWKRQPLD